MKVEFNKALVTGGAGFIGSHLVEALVSAGCRVAVLDNLSSGNLSNLEPVKDQIEFHKNDIRQLEVLTNVTQGCEVIFHLAAVVAVQQTIQDPVASAMVNDIGTINVLEAARRSGVKRFVLASSCAVYGDDPRLPKDETMPAVPASPYAVHKLSGEHQVRVYSELFGLKSASLRFFNVFGPRQDPSSPYSGVISIFMTRAVADQAPVIYGDGSQSRDFVYVKDVVKALIMAAGSNDAAAGPINIGTGSAVTINRLWDLIASLAGRHPTPAYEPARTGDILHSLACIDRAEALLGYKPEFSLEQGLAATLEWYRGQKTDDGRQMTEDR